MSHRRLLEDAKLKPFPYAVLDVCRLKGHGFYAPWICLAILAFLYFALRTGLDGPPAFYVSCGLALAGLVMCYGGPGWWLAQLLALRPDLVAAFAHRDTDSNGRRFDRSLRVFAGLPATTLLGLTFGAIITAVLHDQIGGSGVEFVPPMVRVDYFVLVFASAFGIGVGHACMFATLISLVRVSAHTDISYEALPELIRISRFFTRASLFQMMVYATYVLFLVVSHVAGIRFNVGVTIITAVVGLFILVFFFVPQFVIHSRLLRAKEKLMAGAVQVATPASDLDQRLARYEKLQKIVSLPEWTIRWGVVTAVLNSYLFPTIALFISSDGVLGAVKGWLTQGI